MGRLDRRKNCTIKPDTISPLLTLVAAHSCLLAPDAGVLSCTYLLSRKEWLHVGPLNPTNQQYTFIPVPDTDQRHYLYQQLMFSLFLRLRRSLLRLRTQLPFVYTVAYRLRLAAC